MKELIALLKPFVKHALREQEISPDVHIYFKKLKL